MRSREAEELLKDILERGPRADRDVRRSKLSKASFSVGDLESAVAGDIDGCAILARWGRDPIATRSRKGESPDEHMPLICRPRRSSE